jgi:hypothetical protein
VDCPQDPLGDAAGSAPQTVSAALQEAQGLLHLNQVPLGLGRQGPLVS